MFRAFAVSAAALLVLGCGGSKAAETPPYQCPAPAAPVGTIAGTLGGASFAPAEMGALVLGPTTCMIGSTPVHVAAVVVGLTTSPGLCDSLQRYGFCWDKANATQASLQIANAGLLQTPAVPGPGTYAVTIGTPVVDANGNFQVAGATYARTGTACASLASSSTSALPATGQVTLTAVTSTGVSGSATLTFTDGSTLTGTFTAPAAPLGDICQLVTNSCTPANTFCVP